MPSQKGFKMRTIRDTRLESRAARLRLTPQADPFWKTLVPAKLHLGYRRRADEPGTWLVRHYVGKERYRIAPLGPADDYHDMTESADVIDFAEAQRRALAHKLPTLGRAGGPTVEDAIERYVEALRADRPAGAADAEQRAECSILPKLGKITLAALTGDDITRWRNAMVSAPAYSAKHKAPATAERHRQRRASANRVWGILRAALNKAFAEGLVDSDKGWRGVKNLRDASGARVRFLTVEESRRLLNAADRDTGFRDLVHAALLTGCRYGELCRLQVRDFQYSKLHIVTSKSGRRRHIVGRHIVLTEEGVEFFRQLSAGRRDDDILLRRNGAGPWRKSNQDPEMERAVAAAKLAPISFNGLRHTYASLSIMGGMPLMVLAENLGHVDTKMVTKHYGHLSPSYIDDEIRKGAPRFGMVEKGNVTPLK
jgi:integrase